LAAQGDARAMLKTNVIEQQDFKRASFRNTLPEGTRPIKTLDIWSVE
jgi:hypothetical protein